MSARPIAFGIVACRQFPESAPATDLIKEGKQIFRDDTFGNENFWTDSAKLHEVVSHRIQPLEALGLGLKVDMDRLNPAKFAWHNPFSTGGTVELLKQNAVVGVKATFDDDGKLTRIGITCALCHSTVDMRCCQVSDIASMVGPIATSRLERSWRCFPCPGQPRHNLLGLRPATKRGFLRP